MAQIICEECGSSFSSENRSCPNCGCPIDSPKSPRPPKNNGNKKVLYVAIGVVLFVGVVLFFCFMFNDMAKMQQLTKEQAELLEKELHEQQKSDSIKLERAKEEAFRKAQDDSIRAATALQEQQRIEEEERARREGVQKTFRLNCSVYENQKFKGSSNVCSYIYDIYTATISTKICRVPQGKVWIYKGYDQCDDMKKSNLIHYYPILNYYTKENEGQIERGGKRVYYSNQTIELRKGGVPLLRPGDGIAIRQQFNNNNPGDYWTEVYFTEKDEEYYY